MWIDEDPYNTFVFNQTVSDDYLTELLTDCDFALRKLEQESAELEGLEDVVETAKGKRSREQRRRSIERLAELSRNLLPGLLPPGRLRIERHLAGWTAGELWRAGQLREEIEDLRRGKLNPSLSDGALSQELDKIGAPPRKLAALFYRLADEVAARSKGEIYSLGRGPTGKVTLRGRKPTDTLPPNLLLTDATPFAGDPGRGLPRL
jgi:hypothetical protein